ncbi:uncharacterized protein LOC128745433 [Sabethes cyaneus]|uniref:uncharacterized protein LOC128745433 n=1 Tax=Sabethes cyaneus TaxID=53552 RepID=UPI00237DAF0E|nr:uncharacterized protein LOC128745433 [Sabethes cyaneus]
MTGRQPLGSLMLAILLILLDVILGQIDVMYERIEQINGTDIANFQQIRVRKYNRTLAVLDGTFDLLKPLDDKYEMSAKMAYSSLGNNQFNQYPMKLAPQRLCEFFGTTWKTYQPYFEHNTNLPKVGECPIMNKQYYLKNHRLDSSMLTPYLPRGLWRVSFILTKANDDSILLQIDLYGKVEAKGIF